MENKKVIALEELLKTFDQPIFDLEAWKIKASLVLKKLFGSDDEKLDLIDKLHYDFSSWSLRDNSGSKQHDPVKNQAKEIINAAILELQISEEENLTLDFFKKELSGADYEQLLQKVKKEDESKIIKLLSSIKPAIKDRILTKILLSAK